MNVVTEFPLGFERWTFIVFQKKGLMERKKIV